MSLAKKIISILVTGFSLAIWELSVKDIYFNYLQESGVRLGVFEVGLGYAAVIAVGNLVAWVITWLIVRQIRSEKGGDEEP